VAAMTTITIFLPTEKHLINPVLFQYIRETNCVGQRVPSRKSQIIADGRLCLERRISLSLGKGRGGKCRLKPRDLIAAQTRTCTRAHESNGGSNVNSESMKRLLLYLVITLCAAGLVHADQAIRSLQQTLKHQGLYYGTVTGEKSAETTAAIRRYQIRNGLKVTGEINDETTRSLNASSNSVAAVSQPSSKPAAAQVNSVRPEANASLSQPSPPPSFSQPDRQLDANPSYSASFFQSPPVRVNRRIVAAAQYQLMSRGYYRGRVDGNYGSQTAFAVRSFQSSTGLAPTGRLDMQTLDALGSSDANPGYVAPAPRRDETWIPVTKFRHGQWILKWKKYQRDWGDDVGDEGQQANSVYDAHGY